MKSIKENFLFNNFLVASEYDLIRQLKARKPSHKTLEACQAAEFSAMKKKPARRSVYR